MVLSIEGTLCLVEILGIDGSMEIDFPWEVLFDGFGLFSLSVNFEVAESLMVELLFTRLEELPIVACCREVLWVWSTLVFLMPKFWPLLFTVEFISPPDVLFASWSCWCRWAYLFITNEEFYCCWFGCSNLLSILIPVPAVGWWTTEYLPFMPVFEPDPVCLSLLKRFC